MKESLQLANLFGIARMDNLLQELLLANNDDSPEREDENLSRLFRILKLV